MSKVKEVFHFILLFTLISSHLSLRANGYSKNNHRNVSELLDNLLRGYDNSVRPDFGGKPTVVEIDIMVRSMGPVSEVDMTYSMDCYFRQTWIDKRLSYSSHKATLALSLIMLEKIWKPDSYFYNGKHSYLHTITTPNKFVRLYKDGRVLYSSRLTVKANCPMNLEDFPMDIQRCPLQVGSFGYTTKDVIYRWNPNRSVAVDIAPDMKMSQFDLISTPTGNMTNIMKSGEYSFLVVSFHLERHMGNFLIQVYGPCTLLVILSWVSFWLNREATADRISLGVMTILTMTFLGLEARTNLPKVPYPTALDFFVFLSYVFIFGTILQFAIVHYFTKHGSGEVYFNEDSSSSVESDDDEVDRLEEGRAEIKSVSVGEPHLPVIGIELTPRSRAVQFGTTEFIPTSHENIPSSSPGTQSTLATYRSGNRRNNINNSSKRVTQDNVININSVSAIDRFSRIFFPISFLGINIFYWYSYLYKKNPTHRAI